MQIKVHDVKNQKKKTGRFRDVSEMPVSLPNLWNSIARFLILRKGDFKMPQQRDLLEFMA